MVYLPSPWLAAVFGVFILIAAWEWATLSGLNFTAKRVSYVFVLALAGMVSVWLVWQFPPFIVPVLALAIFWWAWEFFDLVRRQANAGGVFQAVPGKLLAGALVLLPAWLAAVYLHQKDPMSPALVLFLFAIVWVADTSAYFVGRAWGKRQLAPRVSPGKTVEGLFGALVAVLVLAYFCGTMVWKLESRMLLTWLIVAVFALLFSVLGDLVESKLKRIAGMKDSGTWLPGHGGVLDRIDALTAAAPAFALGWILFLGSEA